MLNVLRTGKNPAEMMINKRHNDVKKTISPLKLCQSLLVTLIGVGALSTNVQAEDVSFEGERVEFLMPYKEGGGTDTWGRFYAPFLSGALPGNPTVVVKNVPGGGSTKGANQFARRAKDNGLNILASSASTQYPYLLKDRRVRYDYNDWSVILASPTGGVVYISPETGVKNVQDLKDKKDHFGLLLTTAKTDTIGAVRVEKLAEI